MDSNIVPCFRGDGRAIEGSPCSLLKGVALSASSVGTLVGEIVGVSEAAKVGGGEEGVVEGWFKGMFSSICTGAGLALPSNAKLMGKFARACKSNQASSVNTRIFIASSSTRPSGDIRMLRRAFLLLFDAGCDSSETSEPDVIRI